MAAYAALVSLSQTIQKINSNQVFFLLLDRELLDNLQHVTNSLLAILKNDLDGVNNIGEQLIRDGANRAEDIIEQFMSEQILLRSFTNVGPGHHQSDLLKISEELQDIANRLGSIVEKNSLKTKDLQLDESFPTTTSLSRLAPTSKDAIVGFKGGLMKIKNWHDGGSSKSQVIPTIRMGTPTRKDAIIVFKDDLMKIKDWLCGGSSKLQVIPIVGMGGIGKTTFATYIYNDHLIVEHFSIQAWVKVTQNYDAKEFLLSLILSNKSFDQRFCQMSIYDMTCYVRKALYRRRYLVVIDDMWSTDTWDHVMNLFPDNDNGSWIILTTRLLDVANYVDPCRRHHHIMRFMDEYQSWNLLRDKVFIDGSCPPELESTGYNIAKRCKGLPLAIVVTAGILSTVDQTPPSWKNIESNLTGTTEDEQIKKILSLSYTNLPHYLKPCFLYMGAFPEDYEIHVSKLIKLFVAEGFLEPIESKSLEEWAEESLENLSRRNLVLINKRKSNGKTKSYSLHHLVLKMCISKAQEEKFLHSIPTDNLSNQHRRVSISSNLDVFRNIDGSDIHTIMYFHNGGTLLGYLESFRLLRVLDALKAKFNMFPDEVLNLFHLRFLAFSYTTRESKFCIPVYILHLQNLQTLMVHSDVRSIIQPKSVYLPIEIWEMVHLRHLVSFMLAPLPDPSAGTSPLKNLLTLSVVRNFKCTEEMLKMIPNLKKLGIFYDRQSEKWPNYQLNNLVNLSQLEKLYFSGRCPHGRLCWPKDIDFPKTLKKLTLQGTRMSWREFAEISWPNLQVLKLRDHACLHDRWKTNEGSILN